MPISDEQREEFHRRYEEQLREIRTSRPENWDTMSQEERDRYSGFHTMTEEEITERFGTNTTTITFFGPHHGEGEAVEIKAETEDATTSR